MSKHPIPASNEIARVFHEEQVSVAVGTPLVLDVRGTRGFVVYLNGGTATYQPCNADGTVVPGSSSTAAANATKVEPDWTHFKITASGAACIVARV